MGSVPSRTHTTSSATRKTTASPAATLLCLSPLSLSVNRTQLEAASPPPATATTTTTTTTDPSLAAPHQPPPKLRKAESAEEKMWRKFTRQPLVPIGCIATAYFLASGIKSFSNRDPVTSQRMMRNRVMAQFATIMVFIGYMGADGFDLRLAPMYQDARRVHDMLAEEEAAAAADVPPSGRK